MVIMQRIAAGKRTRIRARTIVARRKLRLTSCLLKSHILLFSQWMTSSATTSWKAVKTQETVLYSDRCGLPLTHLMAVKRSVTLADLRGATPLLESKVVLVGNRLTMSGCSYAVYRSVC